MPLMLAFARSMLVTLGLSSSRALPVPAPALCSITDTAAVASFFNDFMTALPRELRVKRAALAIACAGRPLTAVGFGVTAAGTPVDPLHTVFRAASNSKLVTATAVMQLAEAGAWRLSDEVNQYLGAEEQLHADGLRAPVRIEHLLTHTAGLETRFAGALSLAGDGLTLAEYFRRYRPRRRRAWCRDQLLEHRHGARGLPRRAKIRDVLRAIRGRAHLHAVRDDAEHLRAARASTVGE